MKDDAGLDEDDRKVLDDIDRHGWHVVLVMANDEGPGFAFSVGLYHTFRHPEIIVIGMDLKLMHWMINEAGEWVRRGEQIRVDEPYGGLLEGFDCMFRPVARRHYRDYFGYAIWFYRDEDFPVLQCVWPDKQSRWPWEADFKAEWRPMQPLLQ